ncbi:MAG: DUF2470 domain-containing protein [Chloroflexaceae bacterium]|nr:DUF2470 domain-containing protein [Chloroflexaceae bacterium]
MVDPLTPAVSDRICRHMNDDHSEAIVLYAQVFGKIAQAQAATLLAIDPQGMDLSVQTPQATLPVRIEFERPLADSEDAHHTLIDMVKQARQTKAS